MLQVLFLCTENACRSQMAEGLVNHFLAGKAKAFSAGVRPKVVNPRAIQVSDEHSEHRWVTVEEARDLFSGDHWLVRVIERAEAVRGLMPPELVDYYIANGFEIPENS